MHHGVQFQKGGAQCAPWCTNALILLSHGAQMPLRRCRQTMSKLLHMSHQRHGLLKTKPMWTFMYVLNTANSSTLWFYFSCISYTTTQSIPHLNKPWLSKMVWLSSAFSMRWDFKFTGLYTQKVFTHSGTSASQIFCYLFIQPAVCVKQLPVVAPVY